MHWWTIWYSCTYYSLLSLICNNPQIQYFPNFPKFLNTASPFFFFLHYNSFEKSSKNSQNNYSIINSNLVESFFVWLNEILTANDVLTSKSIITILELSRFWFSIGGFEQEQRRRQHKPPSEKQYV